MGSGVMKRLLSPAFLEPSGVPVTLGTCPQGIPAAFPGTRVRARVRLHSSAGTPPQAPGTGTITNAPLLQPEAPVHPPTILHPPIHSVEAFAELFSSRHGWVAGDLTLEETHALGES